MRRLSRANALTVVALIGSLGGTASEPERALEWAAQAAVRERAIVDELAKAHDPTDDREARRRELERGLVLLQSVRPALAALSELARACLCAPLAPMPELARQLESFLRLHVHVSERHAFNAIAAVIRSIAEESASAALTGDGALERLEEAVINLRLTEGRFGDPAITIASLRLVGFPDSMEFGTSFG